MRKTVLAMMLVAFAYATSAQFTLLPQIGIENPVTKISYTYDAAGNRISKKTEKGASSSEATWYVRDAQGNVLGVYTDKNALTLTEHHVYGSSRLGYCE